MLRSTDARTSSMESLERILSTQASSCTSLARDLLSAHFDPCTVEGAGQLGPCSRSALLRPIAIVVKFHLGTAITAIGVNGTRPVTRRIRWSHGRLESKDGGENLALLLEFLAEHQQAAADGARAQQLEPLLYSLDKLGQKSGEKVARTRASHRSGQREPRIETHATVVDVGGALVPPARRRRGHERGEHRRQIAKLERRPQSACQRPRGEQLVPAARLNTRERLFLVSFVPVTPQVLPRRQFSELFLVVHERRRLRRCCSRTHRRATEGT
mmetsp:Transcript_5762/g.14756  ORF Transcript_5762/g.14756 Transcript_5762/m.14756 type:complete len:271 (-) Transcript_5762:1030-1842(-)